MALAGALALPVQHEFVAQMVAYTDYMTGGQVSSVHPGVPSVQREGDGTWEALLHLVLPVLYFAERVVLLNADDAVPVASSSSGYHSGVPCLPAFRFPAPQNGANITP